MWEHEQASKDPNFHAVQRCLGRKEKSAVAGVAWQGLRKDILAGAHGEAPA